MANQNLFVKLTDEDREVIEDLKKMYGDELSLSEIVRKALRRMREEKPSFTKVIKPDTQAIAASFN